MKKIILFELRLLVLIFIMKQICPKNDFKRVSVIDTNYTKNYSNSPEESTDISQDLVNFLKAPLVALSYLRFGKGETTVDIPSCCDSVRVF